MLHRFVTNTITVIAIGILAAFYALYFIKWFRQRKKGIKENVISAETLRDTPSVLELIMKAAVILTTAAEIASIALSDYLGTLPPDWCRFIGIIVGAAAVLLLWLALRAMRSNWRVGIDRTGDTKLVTKGIYRYSRNPAYLAFDLLFASFLLMFYNELLLYCSIFSALLLHIQIMQEERYLKKAFGEPYLDYLTKVRRYFGKIKK